MGVGKKYNPAVDVLRIIAILAVIFIHTTTRTLEASSLDVGRLQWTLFLNQIFRFAVPLFFMISGFVLEINHSPNQNYFTYIKKRINRIFIPFVFWSAIYYFFIYKQHTENFFQSLLVGDASYQLYFIPALLIFYILFPIIHDFYVYLSGKFIIIILGLIQIILLFYEYYIHPLPIFYPIRVALLNYFVFYVGIIFSHHVKEIVNFVKKWKIILIFITILLGGYIFMEGKNYYLQTHNYLAFYSQWRPDILIYTLFIAPLLYYIFDKNFIPVKIIKTLARLSFFVFFIHVLILEIIWYSVGEVFFRQTHGKIAEQIWYDPLYFLLVTVISFSVAFLIHKVPNLSKISG